MNCEIILVDGVVKLILITAATFKTWKVWQIRFDDNKEAMLYKCGNVWLQRNEDHLDAYALMAIGECIDNINSEKIA